ncbi:sigma-70 family RNA polymerase sigma factor [Alicyclobacillus suci]|nr:sigma-70 family RNA polymerase sigma factor [Alicyclobacillus suci]
MLMERQLPVRERQVLELYYNEMLSEKQIAEILGVSQQRVNQIRKKGLNILRMELIMDDQ